MADMADMTDMAELAELPEQTEYALVKDGASVAEFRLHEVPPVYSQKAKPWVWLPVVRDDGEAVGTVVDMKAGLVTVTKALPPAPVPRKVGSFVEFMDLLSPETQARIDAAALPGTALSLLLKRGVASNEIDLTSPILKGALDGLLADGLIDAAEMTAIVEADFNAAG